MATTIASLPLDLLITIMSLLGKTYGALSVAKAMSVSRIFLEAGRKADGLAEFRFRNMSLEDHHQLYQHKKGLIYECARAGNATAQYLLAKVMLATCTQLLNVGLPKEKIDKFRDYNPKKNNCRQKYREKAIAASFLSHFNISEEQKEENPESSTGSVLALSHRKLVKVFLSTKFITTDILFIGSHIDNYVGYFWGKATYGTDAHFFMHFIRTLRSIVCRDWRSCLVRYQGTFYVKSSRDGPIYPPQQLLGFGGDEEIVDWRYETIVFEEVRKQALQAFDLLIQQLQ